MTRSIGPFVFIAAALAGCNASTATPSRSAVSATPVAAGLSKEQALTVATPTVQAMSSTPVSFLSAASGRASDFAPAGTLLPDPNRHVWGVLFFGTFHSSCGGATASPHPCPPPGHTVRVLIDYVSGASISAETVSLLG